MAFGAPSDWRSVWSIYLSSPGAVVNGVPELLEVVLENRGAAPVEGSNVTFTLYRGDAVFAWAVDPSLRSRPLRLLPRERVAKTVPWTALQFSGFRGESIAPADMAKAMSQGAWSIVLTISDDSTPRPDTESNNTVASNMCRLGAAQ